VRIYIIIYLFYIKNDVDKSNIKLIIKKNKKTHSHVLYLQKSAAKQFSNSLRRSFFCKPTKAAQQAFLPNRNLSSQPTTPSKSSHAVPATVTTPLLSTSPPVNYTSDYTVNTGVSQQQQQQQYHQTSPSHHNQLATANSCNIQIMASHNNGALDLTNNKLSPNSIIKPKKITQQIPPSNVDEGYLNSESTQIAEKTFDMRHLVPPSPPTPEMNAALHRQQLQQQQQRLLQQQQQMIMQARMKQQQPPVVNTNSNNEITATASSQFNTCSNLFMNYLIANNNSPSNANGTVTTTADEEHGLIANYCSRLSSFYAKNPNLRGSPDTPPPPSSNNNNMPMHHSSSAYATVTNINKKSTTTTTATTAAAGPGLKQSSTLYLNSNHRSTSPNNNDSSTSNNYNNNSSRTASLSRHLWSSGRAKPPSNYNTLSSPNNNNTGPMINGSGVYDSHSNMMNAVQLHKQQQQGAKRVQVLSNGGDETTTATTSSNDSPVANGGAGGFFSANSATATTRSRSECNFKANGHHHHHHKPSNGNLEEMSPSSMRASKTIEERILKEKKEIVMKLERQNREIIKEIKRLRLKQQMTSATAAPGGSDQSLKPAFLNLKELNGESSGDGSVDSPKIAGATIIDPLVISLNEQQTPHKRISGYNKVKSSAVMSSLANSSASQATANHVSLSSRVAHEQK
jgi:hypothetical protein